jgi:hypothetical protein
MNELEILRRDALTTAFLALYLAAEPDEEAARRAQGVVNRMSQKMLTRQIEQCRELAGAMAEMEKQWDEADENPDT